MTLCRSLLLVPCAVLLTSSAFADTPTLPIQKPGLWQNAGTMDGKPLMAGTTEICLDLAIQSELRATMKQRADKACPPAVPKHDLDGSWSFSSTCSPARGMTVVSHGVIRGDYNSKIVTTLDAKTSGAPVAVMNGTHHSVTTSVWMGPCKPGQKPGDMILGDGKTINVLASGSPPPAAAAPHH